MACKTAKRALCAFARPNQADHNRPSYAKARAPRCNKSVDLGTVRDHPKLGFTRGDIGSTLVCQRDILDNFTAIQAQARAASDADAMARGVDTGPLPEERYRLVLRNSVMINEGPSTEPVDATVTMPRPAFLSMLFSGTSPASLVLRGVMKIDGKTDSLRAFMSTLDTAEAKPPFPIVTP